MNTPSWLDENNRYLTASLQWLRLKLEKLGPQPEQVDPQPVVRVDREISEPEPKGFFARLFGAGEAPGTEVRLLTEGEPQTDSDKIRQATASRDAAAGINPPPALLLLADRLDLSTFERDTLLLCAAMELDPGLGALCAQAQGNPARNYPTFGLALSLFDDPSWDALSAPRPLRYARLVEISQTGATPLTASPLRADERVVSFLKGLNVLDERLAKLLQPVELGSGPNLAPSQQIAVDTVLNELRHAASASVLPVMQLVGVDSGSKVAVAQHVCATMERRLYRLSSDALPSPLDDIDTLARLWQRESLLLPVALYVDAEDTEEGRSEARSALERFVSREVGLVFLGVRETPLRLSCAYQTADVSKPTAAEQRDAWLNVLGSDGASATAQSSVELLAGQFDLNLMEIGEANSLAAHDESALTPLHDRLWDRCCDMTRPHLDLLAQRLDLKANWNDIVLPEEPMSLLRRIAGQVRQRNKVYDQWGFSRKMNRGFGISVLFAGESGTGKTMAAEVIANELRLNLYRIDLSAVVSKYIGETETNLRKLFDAAEQGGAILLFDEADALFSKRSEVKDSHDRYANIEVNYLLQRMEAFGGLAILATNMKSALDPAFMRRLRFIVNFRFPGANERRRIWEQALPPETPRNTLDYGRLSRLNVTGGNIHSIALQAAFMAAQNGQTVTMPILLSAARVELRKLEKPFNEARLR